MKTNDDVTFEEVKELSEQLYVGGSFVFCISGLALDFEDIHKNLPVKPTEIIKNENRNESSQSFEKWIYEKVISDKEDIVNDLMSMIDIFMPYSDYINLLANRYDQIEIICYLRSLYAQQGLSMFDEVINKLSVLNCSLEFDILSYGGIEE